MQLATVIAAKEKELKSATEVKERKKRDVDRDHENVLRALHMEIKKKVRGQAEGAKRSSRCVEQET